MLHLGDITKIKGCTAPVVDCIIGGSPCQDLSLAGKRAGLAGARSGLYMEQIRIIKEMRYADVQRGKSDLDVRPRYMVWENVPGAFSTNQGKDFAAVIEEAIRVAEPEAPSVDVPEKGWPTSGCFYDEMGKWSVAWRVLDAQFWGTSDKPLPQRRRRIALVADFGGLSAPEILFVTKGVSGNIEPGEQKRKETAGDAGDSTCGAIPCTLKIRGGCDGGGKGALIQEDKSATLSTLQDQTLFQPVAYGIQGSMIGRADQNGPQGDGINEDVSFTLNTADRHAVAYTFEPGIASREGGHVYDDVSGTLRAHAGDNQMAVAYSINHQGGNVEQIIEGLAGTLTAATNSSGNNKLSVAYSIENHPADSRVDIDESGMVQTLTSRMGTGGGNVPMVMEPIAYNGANITSPINVTNPQPGDPCHTLNTDTRNYVLEPITVHGEPITGTLLARDYKGAGRWDSLDKVVCTPLVYRQGGFGDFCEGEVGTLRAAGGDLGGGSENLVVAGVDCRNATEYEERTGTLQADCDHNHNSNNVVRVKHIVRRLTPLECERLQGFPDGWTDIGEWVDSKGKKHKEADSPRYKALGNSIALPPWKWVLKRLCACYERDATMASLFDGIGGFPLIWEQLNGKGSCLWASEIEEFPMAVTKVRFGE